jgi:signal transduction histidine kinase
VDAAYIANRLTTLTHELSTLLDGSLRVIGLAKRSISICPEDRAGVGGLRGPESRREICPEQLVRQLETVDAAMRQMVELVRSSMLGMVEGGAGGVRVGAGFGSSSSLAEAVRHAVDVMTPMAEEHMVRIDLEIGEDLSDIAAGPIYAVITNGVRNAVESIQRAGGKHAGGRVVVRCRTETGRTGRCVAITIEDDGAGLPDSGSAWNARSPRGARSGGDEHVFKLGYTTKPGGSGIGLSLSRDVVEQLGGTIELHPLPKDPHSGRAGAILRVRYPVPNARQSG